MQAACSIRYAMGSLRHCPEWEFLFRPRSSVLPARSCLGFLDLQSSQAQNRFYTELEDWLSTTVYDQAAEPAVATGVTSEVRSAIERLREAVDQAGAGETASAAMANLAEAIQGLVHHMRTEQQMIRDWVDSQADQQREIKKLLEVMVRENVNR